MYCMLFPNTNKYQAASIQEMWCHNLGLPKLAAHDCSQGTKKNWSAAQNTWPSTADYILI